MQALLTELGNYGFKVNAQQPTHTDKLETELPLKTNDLTLISADTWMLIICRSVILKKIFILSLYIWQAHRWRLDGALSSSNWSQTKRNDTGPEPKKPHTSATKNALGRDDQPG